MRDHLMDPMLMETYGKLSWELGVDLPVIKDIFVIYLPFAYSDDIKYAVTESGIRQQGDLIRFELHLNLSKSIGTY